MTESEFRIIHSELIAYFQYIEMHMRGICAALLKNEEKSWFQRLEDYDMDPLGKLIQKLKDIQIEKSIELFSEGEFNELDELRKKRNYWVHQCFVGTSPIVFPRKKVKHPEHEKMIVSDLHEAKKWEDTLTMIERKFLSDKTL